jgi:hypothetical protein
MLASVELAQCRGLSSPTPFLCHGLRQVDAVPDMHHVLCGRRGLMLG